MNGRLAASVALAQAALRPYQGAVGQPDPLRLQIPPVGFGGGATLPDAGALRILAALYLHAELEQVGIISVAEALTAARDALPVRSDVTMGKLEAFARKLPEWYDRAHRNALFARLFGVGPGASNDQGALINRDFPRALAAFCLAVLAVAGANGWPRNSTVDEARLAQTAVDLLGNLGSRQFGNALLAARSVHEQLARALEILNDSALQTAFQAHGLWDLLHTIIGDQSPDFARLLHRGQDGERILEWLAAALPQIGRGSIRLPQVGPQSPLVAWAAEWLDATGILPPSPTVVAA